MQPYRIFKEPNEADNLANWLADQGIDVITREVQPIQNAIFLGTGFTKDYQVQIPAEDFLNADSLLQDYYRQQIPLLDKDYYLFVFTDKELHEVIAWPDKWGDLDYVLAQELLKQRGLEMPEREVHQLKQQRMKALAAPERSGASLIMLCYVTLAACLLYALYIGAVQIILLPASGLFAMFIGWHLVNDRKSLPDGTMVNTYRYNDQVHGRWIGYAGMIWLAIFVLLIIYNGYRLNTIVT